MKTLKIVSISQKLIVEVYCTFLVSGHGLVCQQEISLVLAKTPPIHYWTVINSVFTNTRGSYLFNMREHRVSGINTMY